MNMMIALLPILQKMDGYAMQNERVMSVTYRDTHDVTGNHDGQEIVSLEFPNGNFEKVSGGWVLSVNGSPLAVFPL